MPHAGRHLGWAWDISAPQHLQFDDVKQCRRESYQHIDESDARHSLSDCGAPSFKLRAGEDAKELLSMLFGALPQLSPCPRLPKRINGLGLDGVLEAIKELANGNARELRQAAARSFNLRRDRLWSEE